TDSDEQDNIEVKPGAYVVLTIKDSGCGMDAETRSRIFEPFFTTKSEGTGLGLATVYGIVTQTGGIISVSSEVGAGTTFKIYFPQARQIREPSPIGTNERVREPGSGTLLVVEDEEQIRLLIESVLKSNGYNVLAVNCAEDALKIAANYNGKIDLMLTDV